MARKRRTAYANATHHLFHAFPAFVPAHHFPTVMPMIITPRLAACETCSRIGTALSPLTSARLATPSVASILVVSVTSATATRIGSLIPPLAPASAMTTSSLSLCHSNLPLTMMILNRRMRRFGSGSVRSRLATYGNAALRKLNDGSRVRQMFSCVSNARMTSENRSGTRIGYLNRSLLNSFVRPRKEKFPALAIAESVPGPHTSARPSATGRTSLPDSKKPKSHRHAARLS